MSSRSPRSVRSVSQHHASSAARTADPEIQPADPRARRLALAILAAVTLVAAGLAFGLETAGPSIAEWLAGPAPDPEAGEAVADAGAGGRIAIVVAVLVVVVTIPLGVGALWLMRTGARCRESRRFPPPGFAVLRPTRVQTGDAAVRRGRALTAVAALLVVAGLAIPAFTAMILATMLA